MDIDRGKANSKLKMNHYRWSHLLWIFLYSFLCNCVEGSKVVSAVPIFTRQPKSQITLTGRNATFECKANANNEEIEYLWKLNGSYINEDNQDGFKMTEGSLQIYNITWSTHNGAYECIALTKGLGAIKSKTANLQIAYFYKEKEIFWKFLRIKVWQSFLILAPTYKALPAPTIAWQFEIGSRGYVDISESKFLFATLQGHILVLGFHSPAMYNVRLYHPTSGTKPAYAGRIGLLKNFTADSSRDCYDSSLISFPTVRTRTVPEGSNVTFECLVAVKRCKVGINIAWTKKGDQETYLNETSRRLTLNNVTKKNHQGVYECKAESNQGGRKLNTPFVLNVIEKPKLVKAVKPTVSLPADGILHLAVVNKSTSFTWYKDGEIINSRSQLFEIFPNGNLRIKNPSPAFNGIYQMVFENKAGIIGVSQEVVVDSKAGCGWKIFESRGEVTFNKDTPWWSDVTCTWLFQLPTTQVLEFNIKRFSFTNQATLSLFKGAAASDASLLKSSSNTAYIRGPFITMVFHTKALNVGGFTVNYWPKSQGPPTTVAMKSSTIKPTTSKPTTIKPTKKKPVKAKQKGGEGGSNAGTIAGGIIGALVLVAIILLVIYREKVLRKCGHSGSANMKTTEPTSVPMLEVDTSKQAC